MLPKNEFPTFSLKIPSTNKSVEYRPFLRKEQKILLIASQSGDEEDILRAVKQIIRNCIISPINVDLLTVFDLEYIILKIRAKSVDNISTILCTCPDCNTDNKVNIDIDKIELPNISKIETKIQLSEKLWICMKFPTIKCVTTKLMDDNELLINCVDYIYDDENIYKDFTKEELLEFLDSLNISQTDKISNWIENIPKLEFNTNVICAHCKKDIKIKIDNFENFF